MISNEQRMGKSAIREFGVNFTLYILYHQVTTASRCAVNWPSRTNSFLLGFLFCALVGAANGPQPMDEILIGGVHSKWHRDGCHCVDSRPGTKGVRRNIICDHGARRKNGAFADG